MPGFPLTTDWVPEVAPRVYYCSLSDMKGTLVQMRDDNCSNAMEQAARQAAVGVLLLE